MYRIGILECDENYLWRLVGFLKEHHRESFEINVKDSGFGLDAVDIKTVEYDALFLGDGVENTSIKKDEIPSRTVIGYLTENDACDERHISKYQSMEQIYRQMIKLCESGADAGDGEAEPAEEDVEEQEDFRMESMTDSGETYRVCQIAEELVDGLAVRMLSGNRIKGLLQAKYRDGEWRIRVTGMKRLCDYICENNTVKDKERLLHFFADMIATALSLEEYMLSADRLLLNPKEMYVDQSGETVLIPYIPTKSDQGKDIRQCLIEIRRLCDMLLAGLSGEAKPQVPAEEDAYGSTEEFDGLKKNAKDSLELRQRTKALGKADAVTYIIRKRTGEKVVINRSLFKMGKDASYVDYCIKDNPAVSRNHADIVQKPDGFYLVDKGSLNHTFINGRKLDPGEYRKLEDGCLMQLADDVFEFRSLTK